MSDAKKCDRCGSFYDPTDAKDQQLKVSEKIKLQGDRAEDERMKDFCKKCYAKLEEFMKGKKKKQKRVWTPEQRQAASDRMKKTRSDGKLDRIPGKKRLIKLADDPEVAAKREAEKQYMDRVREEYEEPEEPGKICAYCFKRPAEEDSDLCAACMEIDRKRKRK